MPRKGAPRKQPNSRRLKVLLRGNSAITPSCILHQLTRSAVDAVRQAVFAEAVGRLRVVRA
jgi:hypothetical protein